MNSSGFAILHPTTVTMLSGLGIIIVATLALNSMAQDQSGQSAAMVSKSFRMEMGAGSAAFPLIRTGRSAFRNPAVPQAILPLRPGTTPGQLKAFCDPVQEFALMLSELERIAGQSTPDTAMREVRINVINAGAENVASVIKRTCELLIQRKETFTRDSLQVEIQTWAATPTPAAWLDAITHASKLRQDVHAQLREADAPELLISSSAALWPYADRARPAMTIVLRFE